MTGGPNDDRLSSDTRRTRGFYDRIAPAYDAWLGHYDRWMGLRKIRRGLLSEAFGMTLELGVGTGVNLPLYPTDVELTAVDISPRMVRLARAAAARLGLNISVTVADAQQLPYSDETYDTVVATLFFSAVPSPRVAMAEAMRVLRPGGRMLVLDHVASDVTPVRLLQRALDSVLTRLAQWHTTRTLSESALATGLVIERSRRTHLGMLEELVGQKPS
jgi:ubiquinone/menaquinone biosynthesis C-methylase UbiE